MKSTEVNATLLKNVNKKKILSVIDNFGSISRVEVKNILGKNGKTVTNITNSLIEDGLITLNGYSSFTGGRRRELLTTNPSYGYLIGIQLGVHFIRGIITDFKYKVIVEEKREIPPGESKEYLIKKVQQILSFLVKDQNIPIDKVLGIGFVANGFYDNITGEWILSANNPNWKNVPIKKNLSEQYDVPIYIEHNTRAMALAEKHFGVAKDYNSFIYIGFGAGIGSAMIDNKGRIYRGVKNIAGELGHTAVVPNGDLCSCGKKGCLETVASGWAINKRIKAKILAGAKTEITDLCNGDLEKIDSAMIFGAYNNGDELATEVLNMASNYLSMSIANMINLFNPELIVVGGDLSTLSDLFVAQLKNKIKKHTLPLSLENVKILTTSLNDDAAVLGATTLVRDSYFYIDSIN